jgi:hypothetical protein
MIDVLEGSPSTQRHIKLWHYPVSFRNSDRWPQFSNRTIDVVVFSKNNDIESSHTHTSRYLEPGDTKRHGAPRTVPLRATNATQGSAAAAIRACPRKVPTRVTGIPLSPRDYLRWGSHDLPFSNNSGARACRHRHPTLSFHLAH